MSTYGGDSDSFTCYKLCLDEYRKRVDKFIPLIKQRNDNTYLYFVVF